MEEEPQNISASVVHKSLRKKPLDGNREFTDRKFLFVLLLIIITWLGNVLYGKITAGDRTRTRGTEYQNIYSGVNNCMTNYFHAGWWFILCTMTGHIIPPMFILIIWKYFPKFSTYVIVILTPLLIAYMIFFIYLYSPIIYSLMTYNREIISIVDSIIIYIYSYSIFYTILFIATLVCIISTGVSIISDLFKETLTVFFSSLHLIPLIAIALFLACIVAHLSLSSIHDANFYGIRSNVVIFGGIYLITFIYNFTKMIVSPSIASWYRTENEEKVSKILIFQYYSNIQKHHLGSVALASLPLFSFFAALISVFKRKNTHKRSLIERVAYFFLAFKIVIFANNDYSIIVTPMYSRNLFQSTKTAFHLLSRNSRLSFACIHIMTILTLTLVICINLNVSYIMSLFSRDPIEHCFVVSPMISTSTIIFSPVLLLLNICFDVNLLCKMEEDDEKDSMQTKNEQIVLNDDVQAKRLQNEI